MSKNLEGKTALITGGSRGRRGADMTDLLTSVIAAHGGLDRWRTVRAIDVTFNFSGGLLRHRRARRRRSALLL